MKEPLEKKVWLVSSDSFLVFQLKMSIKSSPNLPPVVSKHFLSLSRGSMKSTEWHLGTQRHIWQWALFTHNNLDTKQERGGDGYMCVCVSLIPTNSDPTYQMGVQKFNLVFVSNFPVSTVPTGWWLSPTRLLHPAIRCLSQVLRLPILWLTDSELGFSMTPSPQVW